MVIKTPYAFSESHLIEVPIPDAVKCRPQEEYEEGKFVC